MTDPKVTPPVTTPTTKAGKRLLEDYPARYGGALYLDPVSRELTIDAIATIEAEAVAAERKRIAAAVGRLGIYAMKPDQLSARRMTVELAAVLAIVRGEKA